MRNIESNVSFTVRFSAMSKGQDSFRGATYEQRTNSLRQRDTMQALASLCRQPCNGSFYTRPCVVDSFAAFCSLLILAVQRAPSESITLALHNITESSQLPQLMTRPGGSNTSEKDMTGTGLVWSSGAFAEQVSADGKTPASTPPTWNRFPMPPL